MTKDESDAWKKKIYEHYRVMLRCHECPQWTEAVPIHSEADFPDPSRHPKFGRCAMHHVAELDRHLATMRKAFEVLYAVLPSADCAIESWEAGAKRMASEVVAMRKDHDDMNKIRAGGLRMIESPFLKKNEVWFAEPPRPFEPYGIGPAEAFANTYFTSSKNGSARKLRGIELSTVSIDEYPEMSKTPPPTEQGAGLAARYPDATKAGPLPAEPSTCDVGMDWDD